MLPCFMHERYACAIVWVHLILPCEHVLASFDKFDRTMTFADVKKRVATVETLCYDVYIVAVCTIRLTGWIHSVILDLGTIKHLPARLAPSLSTSHQNWYSPSPSVHGGRAR